MRSVIGGELDIAGSGLTEQICDKGGYRSFWVDGEAAVCHFRGWMARTRVVGQVRAPLDNPYLPSGQADT